MMLVVHKILYALTSSELHLEHQKFATSSKHVQLRYAVYSDERSCDTAIIKGHNRSARYHQASAEWFRKYWFPETMGLPQLLMQGIWHAYYFYADGSI
jgi:hypothetical protein